MENQSAQPVLQSDDKTRSVLNFYRNKLSHDDPRVIRFFDRKEYYTVLGPNALFLAREFYKTSTVVKELGSGDTAVQGVALNRSLFNNVLRALLVDGTEHTVEVYEDQQGSWRLTKSGSPGKLGPFEEELFQFSEMAETPVVMAARVAVRDGQWEVALAYADISARSLSATHFLDDDRLCALEAALMQIGAKECVVAREAQASFEGRRLRDVLARCGVLATERKSSDFNPKDVPQDLGRLLKGTVEHYRAVLDRDGATACLAALLSFTELMADRTNHGKFTLLLHDTGKHMRMDATAVRALNILKQKMDPNDSFSLYGLMNKARTPMGKRRLLHWLKQPLLDLKQVQSRHDVVETLVGDVELRERLRNAHLRAMPDIERLAHKLDRKKATLQDLCRLYQASAQLPHIVDALAQHEGQHAPLLKELYVDALTAAHDDDHLGKFEALLENAVDLDKIPDEYTICASYDHDLGLIQRDKDAVDLQIERVYEEAAKFLGVAMEKVAMGKFPPSCEGAGLCATQVLKLERSHLGYFFRLSKKEETSCRKKLAAKFTTLEARKDGTKFTNKELKQLGEKRISLDQSYQAKQKHLVERVVEVAASFTEVFLEVSSKLSHLDVLLGFAELSANAPSPYVRPEMTCVPWASPQHAKGEGDLVLQGCRHPCVEVQEGISFIPNDCELVNGKSWFQLITGPNMGGKSTYIRQIGVAVVMAQVGCFVPCESARISIRDSIFARVGAGDSQLRGVSTFMAEMLETASILKGATASSLVIIDELGRGTSTYDGFGLAWAISEHIINEIGCPTLFATHFHELTSLQGKCGVANMHVRAHIDEDSRKLTMLYEVKPGACDQSFGIHCAEFARFPPEVLEIARAKAAELEDFSPPEVAAMGDVVNSKKRLRQESQDDQTKGAACARKFLADFAALPLPQLAPQEAVAQVRLLRAQFEQEVKSSAYLQQVLGLRVA